MKRLFLFFLLLPTILFSQISDTTKNILSNGDTLLTIKTTTQKTASVTYTETSVVQVVKPRIAPPPVIVEPPVSTTPDGYTLVYSLDFSKASDLDPDGNNQYGNGYIDNGQFHSRPKDGVSGGTRSEIQLNSNRLPLTGRIEYDVTYNYIVRDACHTLQFHPVTSGGSASPGLWHVGGTFYWYNWKGGTNTKYPTNFTIPKGRKMHFIIEYKFGSSGYLRHWIDGVKVLDRSGIQVGDGTTPTPKFGFNGGWGGVAEALKSDILYDNIRIYKLN